MSKKNKHHKNKARKMCTKKPNHLARKEVTQTPAAAQPGSSISSSEQPRSSISPDQALFHAIHMRNSDQFHEAIRSGANVNIITKDGISAFVLACMLDFKEAIDNLIRCVSSNHRCAAMFYAINAKKWTLASFILRNGIDPNAHMGTDTNDTYTLLHRLALISDEEALNFTKELFDFFNLYEISIDINNRSYNNISPLGLAIMSKNHNMAMLLASHGASIYITSDHNYNALHQTLDYHLPETCKSLLVLHPKALNSQDPEGRTLLMFAVEYNNHELVDHLLALGADATLRDDSGDTALMLAIVRHDHALVAKLATYACIEIADDNEMTPIMRSILLNDALTFELLLKAGARTDVITPEGLTLLEYAQELQRDEIIALLTPSPPVSSSQPSLFNFDVNRMQSIVFQLLSHSWLSP